MPVDVLQHDDGGIDHHAHGKGETGQRDHVDRAPERGHGDEGAHHRDRNRDGNDERCPRRAQEEQQYDDGEAAADPDVLAHQVDGRVDIDRFVVDLAQGEPGARHGGFVQLGHGRIDALHHFDDVGAGLALGVEGNGGHAEQPDGRGRVLVTVGDIGDVAHRDPRQSPARPVRVGAQDHIADGVQGVQLALDADHVAPLTFLHVARGHRGVGPTQRLDHVAHREPVTGEQLRLDGYLNFPLAAAVDGDPADARHAFDTVLDHVLDKIAELMNRPFVAFGPVYDEPGNRLVLAARGVQGRLVGLVGITVDPVKPVGNQEQGPVHVGADREFERQAVAPRFGPPGDRGQALQPGHFLFLAVQDFALDLGGGGARPRRGHRDDRAVDVG